MIERRKGDRRHVMRTLTDLRIVSEIEALARELRERVLAVDYAKAINRGQAGQHSGLTEGVLAVLSRHQEGLTVDELRTELHSLGLRTDHVDVALIRFVKRGTVVKEGIPRKSTYRLNKEETHANAHQ
jgi:hypothetical protein